MCKMYYWHFTAVLVFALTISDTFTLNALHAHRISTSSTSNIAKNLLNSTTGREKRTLLYLVPTNETCCNDTSKDKRFRPIDRKLHNLTSVKWPNTNDSANKFVDPHLAASSNQVASTIAPSQKKSFQVVAARDPGDILKKILLTKYPGQKDNIENLFQKLKTNLYRINENGTMKNNFSLFLKTIPTKKKRSKNNNIRGLEDEENDKHSATNLMSSMLNPFRLSSRASEKVIDKSMDYKISGKAYLPPSLTDEFGANQPSKINIPFASNVNFDQRIFLLNKNSPPFVPVIQYPDNQSFYWHFPTVSLYELVNPYLQKINVLKKFLCIRKLKGNNKNQINDDGKVDQKLLNECMKFYSKQLCSSGINSGESRKEFNAQFEDLCGNLDQSIQMEFDDENNDGNFANLRGMHVKNYIDKNSKPTIIENPYSVPDQHTLYTLPRQNLYETYFKNALGKKNEEKTIICHTINTDGIVIDIQRCVDKNSITDRKKIDNIQSIKEPGISKSTAKPTRILTTIKPNYLNNIHLVKSELTNDSNFEKSKVTEISVETFKNVGNDNQYFESTNIPPIIIKHLNNLKNASLNRGYNNSNSETAEMHIETTPNYPNIKKDMFGANVLSVEGKIYNISAAQKFQINRTDTKTFLDSKEFNELLLTDSTIDDTRLYSIPKQTTEYPKGTNSSKISTVLSMDKKGVTKIPTPSPYSQPGTKFPYNFTGIDLSSFPCTKHLVTTNNPIFVSTTVTSTFKIQPILQNVIKHTINEFVKKTSNISEVKVEDLIVENTDDIYLLPAIIDTPVLKDIFTIQSVENMLITNVKDRLTKITDLSSYISLENITENTIRSELKEFVKKIPLVHPTVASASIKEQMEYEKLKKENIPSIPITEMKVPPNYLLSSLHNMISQPEIGMQAAKNPIVQKVLIKTMKNSMMTKNEITNKYEESEIQNALDYLIASKFGNNLLPKVGSTEKYNQDTTNKATNLDYTTVPSRSPTEKKYHNKITSTLKSTTPTVNEEDEILGSVELKPTKYFSKEDVVLEYIRKHKLSLDNIQEKIVGSLMKVDEEFSPTTIKSSEKVKSKTEDPRTIKTPQQFPQYSLEDTTNKMESIVKKQKEDIISQTKVNIKTNISEEEYESQVESESSWKSSEEMTKSIESDDMERVKYNQRESAVPMKKIVKIITASSTRFPKLAKSTTPNIRLVIKKKPIPKVETSSGTENIEDEFMKVTKSYEESKMEPETERTVVEENIILEESTTLEESQNSYTEQDYTSEQITESTETSEDETSQQISNEMVTERKYSYEQSTEIEEDTSERMAQSDFDDNTNNPEMENKLFTVSKESSEENVGTIKSNGEEEVSVTGATAKSRTPRTTKPTDSHSKNSKIRRTQRTTNPSTIYDDDGFEYYSTSTASSVETYEDITSEFPKDVSDIPDAYEINTDTSITDQEVSTYSNEYHVESRDLVSSNPVEDDTTESYDYVEERTQGSSIDYPDVLKYHEQSTDIVEKFTTDKQDSTTKRACDNKDHEDDVLDITKINEEFSSTTLYSISTPSNNRQKDYKTVIRKKLNRNESTKIMDPVETKRIKTKTTAEIIKPPRPTEQSKNHVSNTRLYATTRSPLYIGKLLPRSRLKKFEDLSHLGDGDLYYIGDGVRLPLNIRKEDDGSFALTLSDKICEAILKRKCSCCGAELSNNWHRTARRTGQYEENTDYEDDLYRIRARRSHDSFQIIFPDGVGTTFFANENLNDNSKAEDEESEDYSKEIVLHALDNLRRLKKSEINEIVYLAKERYGILKDDEYR